MNRKPIITSIKTYHLTAAEKKLFIKEKPWGIILFKRNIKSFQQVKLLTNEIRKRFNDPYYPILIDEEGGTVSRFSDLINSKELSQKFFGNLYKKNKNNGKRIYHYYLNSICSVMRETGININTIPVLDILHNKTANILKSRCFSYDKNNVRILGNLCISVLKQNKIGSVSKHIPGHGPTNIDSHIAVPVVLDSRRKLETADFFPFKNINSNFVMTAHVLFKKIDPNFVATQSSLILKKIIRKQLNFKGLIISDDICMKALKGNLLSNAKKCLISGCNLVLYCRGNINESSLLLKGINKIDKFTIKKTQQFYRFLR
tara:strand:- start:53 stop:1000 length:948 start_codon:yes stop_codon:yes gene_type:complete